MEPETFAELSGLPVIVKEDGSFVITRKFLEGMERYAEGWPGPVIAVMHPTRHETSNLDHVTVRPGDLRFGIQALPFDSAPLRTLLAGCGFVHWGPHHLLHDLAGVLEQAGVPSVYFTEYSLRTRCQIVAAEVRNPLIRWRRYLWEWQQERRIRRNIPRVSGFEANGTPTFDAYRDLNPHHLLYFDTRTRADMRITPHELEERLARTLDARCPLHLVFSGRLNEMKGAMDLLELAAELRRRGVAFRLSICGSGVLEAAMRQRVAAEGLGESVVLRGVLDFETGLVPFVKREADLFVCCHKQGDPSCTYLETMACGVPIAGYRNEAFAGLLERVDAGWGVPLDDVRALAETVARLAVRRPEIAEKGRTALAFASEHTFERTFDRRLAFFREAARRGVPRRAG